MHKRFFLPRVVMVLLISFAANLTIAQNSNTIFWMSGIPQSTYSNPAFMPEGDFFIGIPGLSSHYSGLSNSGFALRDVLVKNNAGSLYWDEDKLLNTLKNRNMLDGDVFHEWLAFGLRSGSGYFSFSASENINGSFLYPRDFMTLLIKGNDHFIQQQSVADFSGIAFDAMHYRQFAFGYAHQWQDVFSAGVKAKVLFGLSNVWFEKADFTLSTHPNSYDLFAQADILVNTSLPVSLIPIDSFDSNTDFDFSSRNYMTSTSNLGFALDLGGSWKPMENLTLAASVLDLGFIDWKQGVENFHMDGEFEFTGVDINELITDDGYLLSFDNLLDSIKDVFDIEETTRGYRTSLSSRMIIGGAYDFSKKHKVGLLFNGSYFRGYLYPTYNLSYNFKPVDAFGVSVSYSVVHNNFHNIGAGMHINMGAVQFYLAGDNFLGMLQPHTMQATNVQLGLNLVFGYRKKEELPIFTW